MTREEITMQWHTDGWATDVIETLIRTFIMGHDVVVTSEEDVAFTEDGILHLNFGRRTGNTQAIANILKELQKKRPLYVVNSSISNYLSLCQVYAGFEPNMMVQGDIVDRINPRSPDNFRGIPPTGVLFMDAQPRKYHNQSIETYLEMYDPQGHTCLDCKGEGRIALFRTIEDPCRTCGGSGKKSDKDNKMAGPPFIAVLFPQREAEIAQDTLEIRVSYVT